MSIDISNCCPECRNASLNYRVIGQVVNADSRTYAVQFALTCDGVSVSETIVGVTLSCSEEECVEVPLEFTWSGGSCSFVIFLGNSLFCTCDPCALPCDICIEFLTYNDEPNDPMESNIGATIISATPTVACTGEIITIDFSVRNSTGGLWQSTPDPDFYLYFQLYSQGVGDEGCTDIAYLDSFIEPVRIPSATVVGFANHFSCDWDLNLNDGDVIGHSISFTVGSICRCSDLIAEVGVARGQRKTATLQCIPCPEGGGGGGGGGGGPAPV